MAKTFKSYNGAHPYKFCGNKKKTLALALPDEMRLCTMHMNAVTMMMSPMIVREFLLETKGKECINLNVMSLTLFPLVFAAQ